MTLPNAARISTKYSKLDTEELATLGRTEIERLAAVVKRTGGRFADHNLDCLRRAWRVAADDKAEHFERAQAAVEAAKAVTDPAVWVRGIGHVAKSDLADWQ